ncbi:IclR family transcriptional regulator [Streptomyces sp. NPDC050145]|uniref:IclR family transcriptional regulator n=1 Tax=Streptomyces sp. NPDC050145 TaxID=3365602 RepID=UPI00378DDB99
MTVRVQGADGPPAGVMQRAALILDALDGVELLNLSQIAAATRLPLSSTHRALEQMLALRWVHRIGRDYQLGMRIIELGSAASHQNALRSAALPSLYWLHRATGCVVHLGVLDGDEAVYLEKVGGGLATGVRSRVGLRLPARSSVIGKALLAGSSNSTARDVARVREARVVCEHEGCRKGFSCLAVPIGALGHGEAAAISVFGPVSKVRTDHRIRLSVQTAAADIARRMALAQRP